MRVVHFLMLILGMAVALGFGVLIGRPHPAPIPSEQEIVRAQQVDNRLLGPGWVGMFRDQGQLNALRRRGYIYCYRNRTIDADCASAQDEAVLNVFFALRVSKAQQEMVDRSRLSPREFEVAQNPELRSKVIRYCSRLYADHGNQDARILAVCLGNLSEFSPLVAIQVP